MSKNKLNLTQINKNLEFDKYQIFLADTPLTYKDMLEVSDIVIDKGDTVFVLFSTIGLELGNFDFSKKDTFIEEVKEIIRESYIDDYGVNNDEHELYSFCIKYYDDLNIELDNTKEMLDDLIDLIEV